MKKLTARQCCSVQKLSEIRIYIVKEIQALGGEDPAFKHRKKVLRMPDIEPLSSPSPLIAVEGGGEKNRTCRSALTAIVHLLLLQHPKSL